MNNTDIGKAFEKLVGELYFVYGGLRWERTASGFVHNGYLARDTHEMDLLVEQERHSLGNSIYPHHDTHRCEDGHWPGIPFTP